MGNKKYPELDKLNEKKDQALTIYEFLAWLESSGMVICRVDEKSKHNDYVKVGGTHSAMLYKFLRLDHEKIDDEREQLLEDQRELNKKYGK